MTQEEDITAPWHKLAFAQTAPLFIQNLFLHGGHDEMVRNATATFVKYRGDECPTGFGCPCRKLNPVGCEARIGRP